MRSILHWSPNLRGAADLGKRRLGATTILVVMFWLCNPVDADTFRIIDSGKEAAQVRVDMIQQARSEIAIELHRASDDGLVLSYLALLRDAVRRGIEVRFLIDGSFNEIPRSIQAHLVQEGVLIKEYHPVRLTKRGWITQRLHDKVILTDRTQMLIGGRNLEYPFFGVVRKSYVKRAYLDRDAYLQGVTAEVAHRYFMQLWNSAEVMDTRLGRYDQRYLAWDCSSSRDEDNYCADSKAEALRGIERAAALLDRHRAELVSSGLVQLDSGTDWSVGQRDIDGIEFLHDPIGRKGKEPGTFQALLEYMDTAKKSIVIESPYLILSKNSKKILQRAIDRGVKVRVLTNSLASTQNFFAQGGYVGKKKRLVRMGLEVWEYKGPKMLHAKTILIDDKSVIIGNFNIDPRSEFLNTELAVVARDEQLARQLRSSMDGRLDNAWLIGPDGKAVGENRRFPKTQMSEVIKLRAYQLLLVPFIRDQL
ncbi:MAG: phospholipase D family protein [Gammaproteobacteria bacterium]|nr:phospholipase D family protein [Gammaproteobacteria bacterium]